MRAYTFACNAPRCDAVIAGLTGCGEENSAPAPPGPKSSRKAGAPDTRMISTTARDTAGDRAWLGVGAEDDERDRPC